MGNGPSVDSVVKALRTRKNPNNEKLHPVEMRARGYQLYVKEAQVNGETPKPYEEWIKTQE